jgi:hypothetical protein
MTARRPCAVWRLQQQPIVRRAIESKMVSCMALAILRTGESISLAIPKSKARVATIDVPSSDSARGFPRYGSP